MAAAAATDVRHATGADEQGVAGHSECCRLYHRAVELVGKRWTGAILIVLLDGPLRFSEIRQLVPDLSDRLLSERLKELEAEEIVERRVLDGSPVRVEYGLTEKGMALEPAVRALKAWANSYLG
ncbi:MAG TPA: helix-turn-helix domain-containing protein [Thermoleophilaceae bacterium]|nr:helix-turn-helix domain-containing protein [Thermoleophilaceae bacterium]